MTKEEYDTYIAGKTNAQQHAAFANVPPPDPTGRAVGNAGRNADPRGMGYGINSFDPIQGRAYDAQGNDITDSLPPVILQQLTSNAAPAMSEHAGYAMAAQGAAGVKEQLPGVLGANYGFNPYAGKVGQVGDALRMPVGNQAALGGALDAQGSHAGIGPTDARTAALSAQQLGQYGSDIDLLRRSAMGQGPSAAEALAKSQLDDNIRAQYGIAATARGGNVAGGLRAASRAGSDMMLRSQQQMAALRAQEQATAQGQLATAQSQYGQTIQGAQDTGTRAYDSRTRALEANVTGQGGLSDLLTRRDLGAGGQYAAAGAGTAADLEARERMRLNRLAAALGIYSTGATQGQSSMGQRDAKAASEKAADWDTAKTIIGGALGAAGAAASFAIPKPR